MLLVLLDVWLWLVTRLTVFVLRLLGITAQTKVLRLLLVPLLARLVRLLSLGEHRWHRSLVQRVVTAAVLVRLVVAPVVLRAESAPVVHVVDVHASIHPLPRLVFVRTPLWAVPPL